ncbi:hypothetical protein A3A48_02105 [Candidatus Curtissbacteria bacterium RIFCSPLOWO2_01_FULL_37_9]|uniref:DUF2779 domain-containing protein n=1 Tax=Candidatus Curtissbacteria bacterium RIFCSPLOWO2_01_FULL_37_9 TaxID=1797724 RepID=A0A1F5GTM6_9BACT|nr:MAG: hypothetical protein A3A48_02105 [Candidatus Curtissbacteria bacterium RIFCSPLOWO2_01_FULL_37_9]
MKLSKSEYLLFLKHPAWLWLKKYANEKLPPVDDNLQAIFDAGNLFETYAEQLFPGILRLGFKSYEEYMSLPSRTKSALENGTQTIAQGGFEAKDIACISDIVVKVDDNTFDLYEIKSSTRVKPEHEHDLAFQVIVLNACGYRVRNVSVIHVNNKFVRDGEINAKKIASIVDVTKKVAKRVAETKVNIQKAFQVLELDQMPSLLPSHARPDALSDWLEIYGNLADLSPHNIYSLSYPGIDRLKKLEELEIDSLSAIPDDFPLTDKQKFQVLATKLDKEIVEKEGIKKFLSKLNFPLYFLDYETLSSLIPYFNGYSPYQQVPFQYSFHILDSPKAELRHVSYLHRGNSNPIRSLSKSLQKNIGKNGSVIVWNESFEKSCNALMGKLEPEFESFYETLNQRVVDLMLPFANNWYVHKDFGGSASIKNVLPVLVPDLSYKTLGIQEGTTAQRLWMEAVLDGKHDGLEDKIFNNLEEYCKLDTLAMVEIYKVLKDIK